jgi:hypothetical protein
VVGVLFSIAFIGRCLAPALLALGESEMYIPAAIVLRALVRGWLTVEQVVTLRDI